jgi:hypothetical protein
MMATFGLRSSQPISKIILVLVLGLLTIWGTCCVETNSSSLVHFEASNEIA